MMPINRNKIRMALTAVAMIAATITPSFAKLCVSAGLPSSGARSPLVQLRVACPVLGAIVEEFAMQDLGESIAPPRDTRPLLVEARPLMGDVASLTRHAREARDAGATMRDFEEALYLTAVTAGVQQAIAATQTLLGVFAEPDRDCAGTSARADASS
jgi:hypothetical protein